eukprot:4024632-Pyramimonas_sp.AAC.2
MHHERGVVLALQHARLVHHRARAKVHVRLAGSRLARGSRRASGLLAALQPTRPHSASQSIHVQSLVQSQSL